MFFRVWRAYREGLPLAGMEALALEVILQHPEYHGALEHPERTRDKDYVEESNPFLHMSLHMALEEQLSIDQPPGIRDAWDALLRRRAGERHAALHDALECLAETVWRSQRDAMPPDAALYLSCIERRGRT
jgi:hypothetical protein